MEIQIKRPWLSPVAACAPSVSGLPTTTTVVTDRVERAPMSRVHHVLAWADLALLGSVYGDNGITGFLGSNSLSVKRAMDVASGVPPRGRPV